MIFKNEKSGFDGGERPKNPARRTRSDGRSSRRGQPVVASQGLGEMLAWLGPEPGRCPPGRYAVASEPCGSMHRVQGVGSMANTLKVWVELAATQRAALLTTPLALCIERNGVGRGMEAPPDRLEHRSSSFTH